MQARSPSAHLSSYAATHIFLSTMKLSYMPLSLCIGWCLKQPRTCCLRCFFLRLRQLISSVADFSRQNLPVCVLNKVAYVNWVTQAYPDLAAKNLVGGNPRTSFALASRCSGASCGRNNTLAASHDSRPLLLWSSAGGTVGPLPCRWRCADPVDQRLDRNGPGQRAHCALVRLILPSFTPPPSLIDVAVAECALLVDGSKQSMMELLPVRAERELRWGYHARCSCPLCAGTPRPNVRRMIGPNPPAPLLACRRRRAPSLSSVSSDSRKPALPCRGSASACRRV